MNSFESWLAQHRLEHELASGTLFHSTPAFNDGWADVIQRHRQDSGWAGDGSGNIDGGNDFNNCNNNNNG